MNRREFTRRLVASSVLFAISAVGLAELIKVRSSEQIQSASVAQFQSSSVTQSGAALPVGYVYAAHLSDIDNQPSTYFNHPQFGNSLLINISGQWRAFSATCTHRPCTVEYQGSTIYCPCHGATFSPKDGSVLGGPAPAALPEFGVQIENGLVYVTSSAIN